MVAGQGIEEKTCNEEVGASRIKLFSTEYELGPICQAEPCMQPNPVHSRARLSVGHQRHAWLWSACKSNTEDITLKLACFGVTGCDADEGADS